MTSKAKFRSINFKFTLIIAATLLASTVIGTTFIVLNERASLNRFLADKGHSFADYIANIRMWSMR